MQASSFKSQDEEIISVQEKYFRNFDARWVKVCYTLDTIYGASSTYIDG